MREKYSNLINDLKTFNVNLTDIQIQQFDDYFSLLVEWNNKMNLTAITDFDDGCM